MIRALELEIPEREALAEDQAERMHRQLTRIHRFLGDTAAILTALRRDRMPVRRILDVGCGHGGVLREVQRKLGAEGFGVDIRPPRTNGCPFPIIRADAVRDPLPGADVAISLHLAHHLSATELVELIRNVGRSCDRFILLDLVRHRLPLTLFRIFVAPLVCTVVASDGALSVRRAYTPAELSAAVRKALTGTRSVFEHKVAPLYMRQLVDIRYKRP